MMWSKDQKKTLRLILEIHIQHEGEAFSSKSTVQSAEEFQNILLDLGRRFPQFLISFKPSGVIQVTTPETIQEELLDNKLNEVRDILENYVRERAVEMEAYAVVAQGEVRGVFHRNILAMRKKHLLVKDGIPESEIAIKPIQIGSFDDFL